MKLSDFFLQILKEHTYIPQRSIKGPFIFSVDHCFSIKGQGTVMTGTVLNGQVTVNDTIEITSLQVGTMTVACGRASLVFAFYRI